MKTVPAPKSKSNNVRKWLLGALLIGTLAKLWSVNFYDNLESYLLCSALKRTRYTPWMNPDLELNVYLSVVRVLLNLASLVCSIIFSWTPRCNTKSNNWWNFLFLKDEIVSHHNYLAPLSGVLPAWITKLAIRPPKVIHIDPQAAVVPGLAGMLFFNIPASRLDSSFLTDAHAHIIENGLMMELPLADSKSVQGKAAIFHSSKF